MCRRTLRRNATRAGPWRLVSSGGARLRECEIERGARCWRQRPQPDCSPVLTVTEPGVTR
jgi:hypothetical protein